MKKIKLISFIFFLIITFSLFIYIIFKPYNYKKEYFINEYKIEETFNKNDKYYSFIIKNSDKKYVYIIRKEYLRNRELIHDIEVSNNEEELCILPKSKKISFYPLCNNKNATYTYNLSTEKNIKYEYAKIDDVNEKFQNIEISKLNDTSFLIYNYKGFYLINEKERKDIKLFDKDIYTLNLIYQKDNYLIVPNYNQNYFFNKLYIINILNGKVKEIEFDYDISFDSIFLGDYKNNVFLLDNKEEKEYRINIKKNKIEEVEFQILKDNKMLKVDYKKVTPFEDINIFKYEIISNKLYQIIDNTKIMISKLNVDKIIKSKQENVYYISNGNLYLYNNQYGEVLLISYFEWNFNNTNMIYLYK